VLANLLGASGRAMLEGNWSRAAASDRCDPLTMAT
jgi:hypothetical protein